MKVTTFHLRIALYVLAGLLILFGILKLGLGMNLGPLIEENVSNVTIFGAVTIFFWNRHILSEQKKAEEAEKAAKEAEEPEPNEPDAKV